VKLPHLIEILHLNCNFSYAKNDYVEEETLSLRYGYIYPSNMC